MRRSSGRHLPGFHMFLCDHSLNEPPGLGNLAALNVAAGRAQYSTASFQRLLGEIGAAQVSSLTITLLSVSLTSLLIL